MKEQLIKDLYLRFPRFKFTVLDEGQLLTVYYDAYANESDIKRIDKFVDKIMKKNGTQYKLERMEF